MKAISALALAAPAMAFVPLTTLQRSNVRMSAESEHKPAIPVGGLMKGLATVSLFFNLAGLGSAPAPAVAKSGEGPKQSIFGGGKDTASNPFVSDVKTWSPYSPYGTGKDALYKPLSADSLKFYTGKVKESQKRIDRIGGYLDKKQWYEVRNELNRQVNELRLSAGRLAESKNSPAAKSKLKNLFLNIEELDVAASRKQGDVARQAYGKAQTSLSDFLKEL